jgi:hypothetical protein
MIECFSDEDLSALFVSMSMQIMDGEGIIVAITSPENAGRNSLWNVHLTDPNVKRKGVVLITICFPSTGGALSFVDFFAETENNKPSPPEFQVKEEIGDRSAEDEETFPWCGRHLAGFSFVENSMDSSQNSIAAIPGYESLFDGQVLRLSELPQDFAIVPATDDNVGSVKYFLPSSEIVLLPPPFRLTNEWLCQTQGTVKLRADAFAPAHVGEKFLGSCEVTLEVDWSEKITCGPGVTGFYLVNRNGKRMNGEYGNLRNGQVIRGSSLPYGTDLAVHINENHDDNGRKAKVGAVKFEVPGLRDVYEINPPFRMNSNKFYLPGNYTVKAHGYSDTEFSTFLNICELQLHIV